VVDWNSLRHVSWQERTAMVLCDIHDNKTHELVSVAPRSVLRKQIDAANAMGYPTIYSATELEYYQYEASYREAHARNYQQKLLRPSGDYMEDYHILQTSREEKYTSVFRRHLKASGIPTENSKGECGIGQHELNVRYADILPMADRHLVYKVRFAHSHTHTRSACDTLAALPVSHGFPGCSAAPLRSPH
jgi:glutamine synthetase